MIPIALRSVTLALGGVLFVGTSLAVSQEPPAAPQNLPLKKTAAAVTALSGTFRGESGIYMVRSDVADSSHCITRVATAGPIAKIGWLYSKLSYVDHGQVVAENGAVFTGHAFETTPGGGALPRYLFIADGTKQLLSYRDNPQNRWKLVEILALDEFGPLDTP